MAAGKASAWGSRQVAVAGFRGQEPEDSRNLPAPFIDEMYLPFATGLQSSETSNPAGRSYSKIVSSGLRLHHFFLEVDLAELILALVTSVTVITFQTTQNKLVLLQQQHLCFKVSISVQKATFSHMAMQNFS